MKSIFSKRRIRLLLRRNRILLQIIGIVTAACAIIAMIAAFVVYAPNPDQTTGQDDTAFDLESIAEALPPERPVSIQALVREIIRAHGGQRDMERVQSIARTGTLIMPNDLEVSVFYLYQEPDKISYTLRYPTRELRISFDGNRAWRQVRRRGSNDVLIEDLSAEDTLELARDAKINRSLHLVLGDDERLRWMDDQVWNDREYYVVETRIGTRYLEERFFFDKRTFLLKKRERFAEGARPGDTNPALVFELSDYREVEGARFPFRERVIRNGEFLNELVTRELRLNPGVLSSYFSLSN